MCVHVHHVCVICNFSLLECSFFYFPIVTSHGCIVTIHTYSNEDNYILDREIEAAEISR